MRLSASAIERFVLSDTLNGQKLLKNGLFIRLLPLQDALLIAFIAQGVALG